MKTSEQVYRIKAVGAIITGALCVYLNKVMLLQEHITLMAGISLYVALSEGLAIIMKTDRNRTIRIGMGAFLFLWMLTWTLFNTLNVLSLLF
ncbi:MAG: hypothetical protein NWE89_10560 [Candidatus Bathyarchaeota archaeon]|nr:hypothetical protein [Candidatus Bathyarchaeota archaeon]